MGFCTVKCTALSFFSGSRRGGEERGTWFLSHFLKISTSHNIVDKVSRYTYECITFHCSFLVFSIPYATFSTALSRTTASVECHNLGQFN